MLAAAEAAAAPPSPDEACAAFRDAVRDNRTTASALMENPAIFRPAIEGCRALPQSTDIDAALGLAMTAAGQMQGVDLVRRAAEAGSPEALYFFALWHRSGMQLEGRAAIAPSSETFLRLLRRAAETGHGPAQTTLGALYMTGEILSQDYQKAAMWFREAASLGVPKALGALGQLHLRGLGGLAQDEALAIRLTKQAATQGDPNSRWLIAYWTVAELRQTDQTLSEALGELEALTRIAYLPAIVTLGTLYAEGRHVAKNIAYAREIYCRAGERGERAYGSPDDGPLDCEELNHGMKIEGE